MCDVVAPSGGTSSGNPHKKMLCFGLQVPGGEPTQNSRLVCCICLLGLPSHFWSKIKEKIDKKQQKSSNSKESQHQQNTVKIDTKLIFSQNAGAIIDEYLSKFNLYCLINAGRAEEAKLILDLKKELGFSDKYFESKLKL